LRRIAARRSAEAASRVGGGRQAPGGGWLVPIRMHTQVAGHVGDRTPRPATTGPCGPATRPGTSSQ
jgi:hypothetical protein